MALFYFSYFREGCFTSNHRSYQLCHMETGPRFNVSTQRLQKPRIELVDKASNLPNTQQLILKVVSAFPYAASNRYTGKEVVTRE